MIQNYLYILIVRQSNDILVQCCVPRLQSLYFLYKALSGSCFELALLTYLQSTWVEGKRTFNALEAYLHMI